MTVEPLRVSFRRQVRERTIDAARQLTIEHGWDQVRVGTVAELAGVSRPTVYREFGNKDGLGEAVVMNEVTVFLDGIEVALDRDRDQIPRAIAAAVRFTLESAAANPLLHSVLTATRGGDSLLPFLTSHGEPLLDTASRMLRGWFSLYHPQLNAAAVDEAIDAVVRLVVSHLVLPVADIAETARRLSRLTTRYLGLPDGPI